MFASVAMVSQLSAKEDVLNRQLRINILKAWTMGSFKYRAQFGQLDCDARWDVLPTLCKGGDGDAAAAAAAAA
eukprot:5022751-Ditylum_brightwellii.AAC.1